MKFPLFFSDKMVADSGHEISPSAHKPKAFVDALIAGNFPIEIIEPEPITREDFYRAHDRDFVDGVFNLTRPNGFDNMSESVAKSLPYTSGAMLAAARKATKELPAIAPVSGFHHAEFYGPMGFCTFNGLMISALILMEEGKKVAIIDCDMHYGNGTDDIIQRLCLPIYHNTFGKHFKRRKDSLDYLKEFVEVKKDLIAYKPDIILYQAGADPHVDDPYGGVLTNDELLVRDLRMFLIAKELGISLCWNLAGGYQKPLQKVLDIHLNTVKGAMQVYGLDLSV